MELLVFKIDKIASKNFNEEEHRRSEKEEFETLERAISLYVKHFLKKKLINDSQDFCEISHNVKEPEGSKTDRAEFLKKVLFWRKSPSIPPR